jgi:hypothetical protein
LKNVEPNVALASGSDVLSHSRTRALQGAVELAGRLFAAVIAQSGWSLYRLARSAIRHRCKANHHKVRESVVRRCRKTLLPIASALPEKR